MEEVPRRKKKSKPSIFSRLLPFGITDSKKAEVNKMSKGCCTTCMVKKNRRAQIETYTTTKCDGHTVIACKCGQKRKIDCDKKNRAGIIDCNNENPHRYKNGLNENVMEIYSVSEGECRLTSTGNFISENQYRLIHY